MTIWKCNDLMENIEIFWNRTGNVELRLGLLGLAESLGNVLIVIKINFFFSVVYLKSVYLIKLI